MKVLLFFLQCISSVVVAQNNDIAQFAIWSPKDEKAGKFEKGYKEHLNWHKIHKDKWSWYGWFITSGPRFGKFIDATLNHAWSDFDNAILPSEDSDDNVLHVYPFGEFEGSFKVSKIARLSMSDSIGLQSKLLRLITISVNDFSMALKVIDKLKTNYESSGICKNFFTFNMVDGGNMNQLILLIGFNNYADYGKSENIQVDLNLIEKELKAKVINGIQSETLSFRPDLSLFSK